MSDNTALIQDLFGSIAQEGWSTKFNDALADDLVWVATGSSPVAGTYKGKQVYLEKIIKRLGDRLQSWPKPVVENLFVDGDTACIQFHGEGGVGKNGANFDTGFKFRRTVNTKACDDPHRSSLRCLSEDPTVDG